MKRRLLLSLLLLPVFQQPFGLSAQSIILHATHYDLSPDGDPLQHFQAQVEVRPEKGSPYSLVKDCDGTCIFDNLPKGSTLIFSATKADEPKAWVGTGDLILINKHILSLAPFQHPALLIAADADCNGLIENKDIVVLRKLVLKIDSALCYSWKLIDASAILPADPFQAPLPATITIPKYNSADLDLEFLAIKTGNVDAVFPAPRAAAPVPGEFVAAPQPNPSGGAVWFGVQLPEPAALLFEIFDTGGRLLFFQKMAGQAGAQQVELPAAALPGQGLYIWRVSAGEQMASGKLVRM